MRLIAATALAAGFMLAACGGGNDRTVPRRKAYPRVELYDTVYSRIDSLPVKLDVNSAVTVGIRRHSDSIFWIDVAYPRYGATIHYTLQLASGESLSRAIDNRMERMALDLGGATAEITELSSPGGVGSVISVAPSAALTPIHLLSTDSCGFLLSGTVEFRTPDMERNAPAVKAIYGDLLHASKTVSR